MPAERSDGELLLAAKEGDQLAWSTLVRRLTPRLLAVARGFGLGPSDAADVSQLAWLRLLDHVDDLRDPERVGAWLMTTIRNEAFGQLRRSGRQVPMPARSEEFEVDADAEPGVDARLLRDEREAALVKAFARLPARCQVMLRLLFADRRPSYGTLALALDMPVGSIGPTRGRCVELLRRELGHINGEDGGSSS